MKKILILFAHPVLQGSRVNMILADGLEKIENVTFHNLYEAYPDFDIDVKEEQALLEKNDIVIMMHPFFWYSTPAILKEWQDLVLQHNWAYGHKGNKLKGKIFFNVLTTGGKEEAYQKDGYNRFTIRELLVPIEQTARLCKMIYLPPFTVHGTHSITHDEVIKHRDDLNSLLIAMTEERINLDNAKNLKRLNSNIQSLIK
jgi:glutathione-regulated potassium-efflux system ancillary protein KefG